MLKVVRHGSHRLLVRIAKVTQVETGFYLLGRFKFREVNGYVNIGRTCVQGTSEEITVTYGRLYIFHGIR